MSKHTLVNPPGMKLHTPEWYESHGFTTEPRKPQSRRPRKSSSRKTGTKKTTAREAGRTKTMPRKKMSAAKRKALSRKLKRAPRYKSGPKKGQLKKGWNKSSKRKAKKKTTRRKPARRRVAKKKTTRRRTTAKRRTTRRAKPRRVTIRRSAHTGRYIRTRRGYSNPLAIVNPGGSIVNKLFNVVLGGLAGFGGGWGVRNISPFLAQDRTIQGAIEILAAAAVAMVAPGTGQFGKIIQNACVGASAFGMSKVIGENVPGMDIESQPALSAGAITPMDRLAAFAPESIESYAADTISAVN